MPGRWGAADGENEDFDWGGHTLMLEIAPAFLTGCSVLSISLISLTNPAAVSWYPASTLNLKI